MAVDRFTVDVRRFFDKVGVRLDQAIRRTVIDIHDRVVLRTPVDTGRARASWTIGVGKADLSVQPPEFLNPTAGPSVAKEQQRKLAEVKKGARIVYISNNLPYILALEHGHSQQAPHGMVRLTVAEVTAEMNARL